LRFYIILVREGYGGHPDYALYPGDSASGLIRNQPFNCIFERSECPDLVASVLGTECKELGGVKFFKGAKNGRLSKKGLAKVLEFKRQMPKVGYGNSCLRLSSV
jgi:hypothetical protein